MQMSIKILSLLLILSYSVCSVMMKSNQQSRRVLFDGQNLLRLDSVSLTNSCVNFNGVLCTLCKAGFILTNGNCYQMIPNCLIQFTNICATCQTNYRPVTSLSTSQQQSPIPSYVIICIPNTTNPLVNSTSITNVSSTLGNSSSSIVNPLSLLGRETFINWNIVEVRYPTDVYLVMIWNYLDGSEDLSNKIKIQQNNLTSCVQGRVKDGTDRLSIIKWVIDNQLTNFVEGYLIDLSNLYFYRLRYKSKITQIQYEILVFIHEINFKITLLQQVQIASGTTVGSTPNVGSNLTESEQVKGLRQQVLDLKLKVSQQKELNNQRQIQMLLSQQYTMLSLQSIQTDPNCIVIKTYLQNSFTDFIKLLQIDPTSPTIGMYSWMNFSVKRVYFKKFDSIDKQYLYEIDFTTDITVLAQFILNRTYQITSTKVIYTR